VLRHVIAGGHGLAAFRCDGLHSELHTVVQSSGADLAPEVLHGEYAFPHDGQPSTRPGIDAVGVTRWARKDRERSMDLSPVPMAAAPHAGGPAPTVTAGDGAALAGALLAADGDAQACALRVDDGHAS